MHDESNILLLDLKNTVKKGRDEKHVAAFFAFLHRLSSLRYSYARKRLRSRPASPITPEPKSSREAGSGVAVVMKLCG